MKHYAWEIDPTTGDYAIEAGSPVRDETLKPPAFYRLRIQRKSWMYAPDTSFGSDFATLRKQTQATRQALVAMGERALQPLVDDGRAESVTFMNESTERFQERLACEIIDIDGNRQQITLNPIGV